jgi:hypothetical protein
MPAPSFEFWGVGFEFYARARIGLIPSEILYFTYLNTRMTEAYSDVNTLLKRLLKYFSATFYLEPAT